MVDFFFVFVGFESEFVSVYHDLFTIAFYLHYSHRLSFAAVCVTVKILKSYAVGIGMCDV